MLICCLGIIAQASCTPKSNRFGIVFTNNFVDIYRIPDNTQSKIEQLTFTPTIGEYPILVSKNGNEIIFEAGLTGISEEPSEPKIEERQQHVYILNTSSKQILDITNILVRYAMVPHEFSMDWSPDQKQFVVLTDEVIGSEIRNFLEFVDFEGKNKNRVLIPNPDKISSVIQSVKWSPDGKKFLLKRGVIGFQQQLQNPGSAILIYELERGNLIQLTTYQDDCFQEEWSPSSQQIVARCSSVSLHGSDDGISGPPTIRIFDIGNPGQPYEYIGFTPCYDPSWSPDGKQIAFICDKGTSQKGLFIINSDGNGIREIRLDDFGKPAALKKPTWSPDGTQIIYVAGTDTEHTNIYSINSNGSNNHSLTNQNAFYQIVSTYALP